MKTVINSISLLFCCVLTQYVVEGKDFPTLDRIRTLTPAETQQSAVQELIGRLIPLRASDFLVTVDSSLGPQMRDTFKLLTKDDKLSITATTGVAAAMGFYYYLSQYCGCHISWAGNQVDLPPTLPVIAEPGIVVTANDKIRYYQNVCTVSYSFVWWDWSRWEREIDWMAMNGINLPLAFNGQEAIWQKVYLAMGFKQKDLDAFFGGPVFLAWSRMGNMRGWGGPLTQSWHSQQVALQHKILKRMRELGITPVLPAFTGHVPAAITKVFPHVNVTRGDDWGDFESKYCCVYLLDVEDPLFSKIGNTFLNEYISEFGTNHVYNTDIFNEMNPPSGELSYLAAAGKAIFNSMTEADPQAIWLMQGWLFQSGFWTEKRAEAMITAVPQGRMLILDLFSEVFPQYNHLKSYFGQPFIWCMLHNFGGTLAMYGAIEKINKGPFAGRAFPNSTMVGTGITPEGINQNNMIYEFMSENAWRKEPRNISAWVANYSTRRYGAYNSHADNAWQLLKLSVYNCSLPYRDHSQEVVVVRRPVLSPPYKPPVWYQPEELYKAWDNMLMAADSLAKSDLFRYDLVDVTRQCLQVISILYYNNMLTAYKTRNLQNLMVNGKKLIALLEDLDLVLASDDHFLLGRWIESAKAQATNKREEKQYEYNARSQITLWEPTSTKLMDYANKQWAGLVSGYYKPRWELFLYELRNVLMENGTFNQQKFNDDVFRLVEQPFTFEREQYPTKAMGDPVKISRELHAKFRPETQLHSAFFQKLPDLSKFGKKFVKYASRWTKKYYSSAMEQKTSKRKNSTKYKRKRLSTMNFMDMKRNSFSLL